MKILLIEDNLSIQKGLLYSLKQNQYEVLISSSCKEALNLLKENEFSLIILDVSLPDGNGFDLYKLIKEEYEIPTIFLTARDLEEDIVKGFSLGAEDYITKPFLMGELLARIKRIFNRSIKNNIIEVQDIKIDTDKMTVYKNNKEVILTTLEYNILLLLFTNLNRVITRDIIIDKIFLLTGNDVYDNTVTVYIKRIREKLNTDIIKTNNIGLKMLMKMQGRQFADDVTIALFEREEQGFVNSKVGILGELRVDTSLENILFEKKPSIIPDVPKSEKVVTEVNIEVAETGGENEEKKEKNI